MKTYQRSVVQMRFAVALTFFLVVSGSVLRNAPAQPKEKYHKPATKNEKTNTQLPAHTRPSIVHLKAKANMTKGMDPPQCDGTCYEARQGAYPCSGYAEDGYVCAEGWCAACDPGGTPGACAKAAPGEVGSSRPDPATGRCVSTCNWFDGSCANDQYFVITNMCPGLYSHGACTADWCCETKATCDTFAGSCPGSDYNVGSSVHCQSDAESCTASTCCKPKATCASFTDTCGDSEYLVNNEVCLGDAASCTASICCKPKATCAGFSSTCPVSEYNVGSSELCSSDSASCSASVCCKAKATCDSFSGLCPHTQYKLGSDALCPGDADSCSFNGCCSPKAICSEHIDGDQCPDGEFVMEGFNVGAGTCPGGATSCTTDVCCTSDIDMNVESTCKDCCDDQMIFDIMMCTSFMCTKCDQDWCMKSCQEVQRDYPTCRCRAWPKARGSYSSGDFAHKGKYGNAGDYALLF